MKSPELIVALDVADQHAAASLVDGLGADVLWYKIGKQMFTKYGPEIVGMLKNKGKNVFLDLKYHDIPNTVSNAIVSAIDIGADMVNVHASGGRDMLEAAAATVARSQSEIRLIAVTVLTSMEDESIREIGISESVENHVVRLSILAENCGIHGVVASAREVPLIRAACADTFVLVIPGVRPAGAQVQDQKRVATPAFLARNGADYAVVGRPITKADDPRSAAQAILKELASDGSDARGLP